MARKKVPVSVHTDPDGSSHTDYNGVRRYYSRGSAVPEYNRTKRKALTGSYQVPTVDDPPTPEPSIHINGVIFHPLDRGDA